MHFSLCADMGLPVIWAMAYVQDWGAYIRWAYYRSTQFRIERASVTLHVFRVQKSRFSFFLFLPQFFYVIFLCSVLLIEDIDSHRTCLNECGKYRGRRDNYVVRFHCSHDEIVIILYYEKNSCFLDCALLCCL